jgi:hypothetical protein
MEPEWNHIINEDDATMLGLRPRINYSHDKFLNMHFGWLKNRVWTLKFSFANRVCYISGKSLRYCLAYRGRKQISGLLTSHKTHSDDIWISQSEYLKLISLNKV